MEDQKTLVPISLAQRLPAKHIENFSKRVWEVLDRSFPKSFVRAAIIGQNSQMRRMEENKVMGILILRLPIIAKAYGANKELDKETIKECAKVVYQKFGFLSVDEIQEAYRQFASGEIKQQSGEMFWGVFNALNLSRVLSAYCQNRKRIVAKYLTIYNDQERMDNNRKRIELQKQNFELSFMQSIENAKSTFTSWHEVPMFWYKSCVKRGLLTLDHQTAHRILDQAKLIAIAEKAKGKEVENENPFRREKINIDSSSKIIARKLSVWIYVLNKPFDLTATKSQ